MSATVKGKGVVFSVGTLTYTGGIVSADNASAAQSQQIARTSEKAELKDVGGTIIGQVYHGFRKVLTITVVPYKGGATPAIAGAVSSADAWSVLPGTKVIITDAGTATFPLAADTYNVLSSRQGRTVDGIATVDLELEAGDEGVEIATDPIV